VIQIITQKYTKLIKALLLYEKDISKIKDILKLLNVSNLIIHTLQAFTTSLFFFFFYFTERITENSVGKTFSEYCSNFPYFIETYN